MSSSVKSKTLAQIHEERKTKNTFADLPVGTHVKVVTPCCDFRFFYDNLGVVTKNTGGYLGVHVTFDEPMHYTDGSVLKGFSFMPEDLEIVPQEEKPMMNMTQAIEAVEKQIQERFKQYEEANQKLQAALNADIAELEIVLKHLRGLDQSCPSCHGETPGTGVFPCPKCCGTGMKKS